MHTELYEALSAEKSEYKTNKVQEVTERTYSVQETAKSMVTGKRVQRRESNVLKVNWHQTIAEFEGFLPPNIHSLRLGVQPLKTMS